ncbi:RHS repeat-associated core domain-containing protein [Arundinibacter roseus]|uniref:RHS repeat-associated core domain-containing protein n=1 Tax=Arundinibacter roseus TaxID=2070510 RepID=A0A4R4JY30_9BACT|nr:RHS repeat-associated core domain-containing protein [Arundinibacter roseus]
MQQETGWLDLKARFYDPTLARFLSVDPLAEAQEFMSPYHYGYNNPIRFSDPNGKMPDGPGDDPFLIARLAATAFFDTKHAIINTAARAFGSDIRAGYKVEGGQQVFETQISKQVVDNSLLGQVREAVNTVGDVALVATAGASPANPGNLLSKTSVESQVVKAGKEVAQSSSGVKISNVKGALRQVYDKLGISGSLPKGEKGKFGSPTAGDSKKGYRLDPAHPDRPKGHEESVPHINYWDWTNGKKDRGGKYGAIPLVDPK